MEDMDNTELAESPLLDHDDDEMFMSHVIQEDPELMYLHVCLSELLCSQEESV